MDLSSNHVLGVNEPILFYSVSMELQLVGRGYYLSENGEVKKEQAFSRLGYQDIAEIKQKRY